MANYLRVLSLLLLCVASAQCAQMEPFFEDATAAQAPQEIVALTQKAAGLVGFTGTYEVAVPKKAGITINPWTKFIVHGIHPQTRNPFLLINPEWLATMPEDQQLFLLGRSFVAFQEGATHPLAPYIPYGFLFLVWALIFVLMVLFGKISWMPRQWWLRLVIAWVLVGALNIFVLSTLQVKIAYYLAARHDKHVALVAVQKMGNKEAAIKALRYYHESIAKELEHNQQAFAPAATIFKELADMLKTTEVTK